MLEHELRGEPYSKAEHNRTLQRMLRNRTSGAIEFKHANISAVLIEFGFPYIDGYKPRGNYQELLRDEIELRIASSVDLEQAASAAVSAPAAVPRLVASIAETFVDAPRRDRSAVRDARSTTPVIRRAVDYLEREARNVSLGASGELFALELEDRRLREEGRTDLANRIEHVSRTQGDGLGYDIVSFDSNGRERFIEVKTTRFGASTPFFASRNEVRVSEELSHHFHLYRLFAFRTSPRVFVLPGSLRHSCILDAIQYAARPS